MVQRHELECKANKCRGLLDQYKVLIDSPLVSFLMDDQWRFIEELGWSEYLLSLSDHEVSLLPDPKSFPVTSNTPQSLVMLVSDCLDIYGSFTMVESEIPEGFVKLGMSPKKQHEVYRMGNAVKNVIERNKEISQVIDFGSGKGYLPEYIALTSPGIQVVGLDREEINTLGGSQRNRLMEKQWLPLFKKLNNSNLDKNSMNHYRPVTLELKEEHICKDFVSNVSSLSEGFVSPCDGTMLVGLHACGDLTSLLLQTFIKCPQLQSIVAVGCCYHLITQKERTQSYMTDGPHKKQLTDPNSIHAYPISKYLQQHPLYFTRNALNLASQAPERMSTSRSSPAKNLFYRAVFHVLLQDEFGSLPARNVGHAASAAPDFNRYCKTALKKLKLCDVSDPVIQSYYERFNDGTAERQLYAFHQLRILLTRVIESLILIDRMLFLHDNEIEPSILGLFDPVVSPRCYVLVAEKL